MAPAEPRPAARVSVEVVYCPGPHLIDATTLELPAGTRLIDALEHSGVLARNGLSLEGLRLGIWGKPREPDELLRDRDRIELYRPLRVDPKEARRQRYKGSRKKA